MTIKVAVLIPSTGRAAQMVERVSELLKQALPDGVTGLVYLAIPADDKETLVAAASLDDNLEPVNVVKRPANTTAVEGWNAAYRRALLDNPDWFVLGADDIKWHPGWLEAALISAQKNDAAVVGLNDGHTNLHHYGAHYMVSAEFAELILGGVFIPPHYQSWWFDREICERADSIGVYVACWEATAEHLHPEWGTAEMDPTYEQGYPLHEADRLMYEARKAAGWPTDYEPIVVLKGAKAVPVVADPDPTPEIPPPPPRKKAAKKKAAAKGAKKS